METTRRIQEVNMIDEYDHSKGFAVIVCFGIIISFIVTLTAVAFFVVAGMNALYNLLTTILN